ncbi:metal-dependent hydrolase [Halorhabdus amylolytica]|uniref:metal-dependent hydrolase n=1 Tax=Halorhabdus amylolytica TaxID=2559573 RepID=UPI0010AA0BB4|nr:metal-dependent hydrolase [Halorhabdus amylolytica]
MHREGHIGAALLAYAPVGFVIFVVGFEGAAMAGAVGAGLLAMVPDYDQRVPGISHRGITHTVWFAALVGIGLGLIGVAIGSSEGILTAVGLGAFGLLVGTVTILSHIAADALTPMGVEPFAPVRDDYYSYDVARAANPIANYALLALGIIASGAALVAGNVISSALL